MRINENINRVSNNNNYPSQDVDLIKRVIMDINQTALEPFPGNYKTDAWNWLMGEISYLKAHRVPKELLCKLEENVVINFTDYYLYNFQQFIEVVDDLSPILIACEHLLAKNNRNKAWGIISPYYNYVISFKDEYLGKQNCIQNKTEYLFMRMDYPERENRQNTKDNYAYLFVLYCKISDCFYYQTVTQTEEHWRKRKEILSYALDISPWNSSVYEALSHTISNEEEYKACINKALRYATKENSPYGLVDIYERMAFKYAVTNPELSQALCYICKDYGRSAIFAKYILSKEGITKPTISRDTALEILKKEHIQLGLNPAIRQIDQPQSSENQNTNDKIQYCPRCGRKVADSHKFCIYCGNKLK